MAKQDKKPALQIVTDPAEIERLKRMESTHERALEQAAREARGAKFMAKVAAKMAAGVTFNIIWHKIEALHEDGSALLRGHICESRDKHGKHFGLSVEVDYRKLFELNPARQELLDDPRSIKLAFNQQRATSFQAGTFASYEDAKSHMRLLDQYLMHVLAETGAENTLLEEREDSFVLLDNGHDAASQSYSEALRTARLVEAFRSHVIDAPDVRFREAVGILVRALTDEFELPFTRKEKEDLGQMNVRCIFDREVGEFTFTDRGPNRPAYMKHEIPTNGTGMKKLKFEGILTTEALQKQFIDWLAAAARERETISQPDFENLHGQIRAIKGVPLRTSKLGFFAPFPTEETGRQNFSMN